MNNNFANKFRPDTFEDIIGQDHLIGKNGIITKMMEDNKLMSFALYGKAGCGKTTIARVILNHYENSSELNAATCNKKDIQIAIETAKMLDGFILVLDEIHRLNKDKQDLLLPYVENGLITLIGITNQNPYHVLNTALRSRILLLEVRQCSTIEIETYLLKKCHELSFSDFENLNELISHIISISSNDIRYCINQLQLIDIAYEKDMTLDDLKGYLSSNIMIDKNSDYYYNTISALQKSIRGSDVNAALFYLAILIIAEDLDIIERRLSIIAYEDIGLAAPEVVDRCLNALKTARMVGFPEAKIPLAFTVVEMALSPKSNRSYNAIASAISAVESNSFTFLPYFTNDPSNYNQKKEYEAIAHEYKHFLQYMPNELKNTKFYYPKNKSDYEKHLSVLDHYLSNIKRTNKPSDLLKEINKKNK